MLVGAIDAGELRSEFSNKLIAKRCFSFETSGLVDDHLGGEDLLTLALHGGKNFRRVVGSDRVRHRSLAADLGNKFVLRSDRLKDVLLRGFKTTSKLRFVHLGGAVLHRRPLCFSAAGLHHGDCNVIAIERAASDNDFKLTFRTLFIRGVRNPLTISGEGKTNSADRAVERNAGKAECR